MVALQFLANWLGRRLDDDPRHDRGDVPGWVMVTVMSAILVVAIIAIFEPEITKAISDAIDSVTKSS